MNFIIKTTPEELARAQQWWQGLDMKWKMAYNQAVFGKGPTLEPPKDDELMILLIRADTLRFAGPLAVNPNVSTPVDDLNGLVPLYHLRYISITNMNITSLKPLQQHVNLEHLFIYENKITSLTGIEYMVNLKDLYCQGNQLTSLKPIQGLTNLETIYASNNQLKVIDGLTPEHAHKLKGFYIMPNAHLPDREVIRTQNEIGIICRKG